MTHRSPCGGILPTQLQLFIPYPLRTRLLLSDAQSMPSHTLAPGARETAPSPSYLERDLKIMVNFYLILFYATLILLSRQVCRLPCPASAEQMVWRAGWGGQYCRWAGPAP